MKENQISGNEHLAKASVSNLSVSTKHSIELCRNLRYKTTARAKQILEGVIVLKKPIPFRRFTQDLGHKPGIGAGRFPQKAASEFLKLINAVESNAQFKGLNTSSLKITKILANKASVPMTGGRHRTSTKRTNLEIEVREAKEKKKMTRKQVEPKKQAGEQKK
ncbi:MAG: 50S ribosomal protein L22 [Candidatus Woesearchaeota archaeon]